MRTVVQLLALSFWFSWSGPAAANWSSKQSIQSLCHEIGSTLGSVSVHDCLSHNLTSNGGRSVQNRPLAFKVYPPLPNKKPLGRVLLMGGIHGDEYSSVSIVFKWMKKLDRYHAGNFHWKVIPVLNPDGLVRPGPATRQNAAGVDLNRNFPSGDWKDLAMDYWKNRTYRNPRRYPGPRANSEPETQWFVEQIRDFQPDIIIAVHAPHKLVDYDGPLSAPANLGPLELRQLGIYPGSLGNYGGVTLSKPVITIELPSAGIIPKRREISQIWSDLLSWMAKRLPLNQQHQRQLFRVQVPSVTDPSQKSSTARGPTVRSYFRNQHGVN